jgi:hypothetical protein
VLVVGGEPSELLELPPRAIVMTMASVLLAQPIALGAFLFALLVVVIGGSLLMFYVKGGTVAVLVAAERGAGAIEHPPLRLPAFRRAAQFSVERFVGGAQQFFGRYVVLGSGLMLVYGASTLTSLALYFAQPPKSGWVVTAALSLALVVWITIANLLYLLLQVVVGAEDCGPNEAVRRVAGLLRAELRTVGLTFAATLVLVVLATAASILATAALGFIAFVPLIGIAAAVPLQVVAWIVRGLVFEFIGLTALVAYLRIYRSARGDVTGDVQQIGRTA